jgi:hypothetical protein
MLIYFSFPTTLYSLTQIIKTKSINFKFKLKFYIIKKYEWRRSIPGVLR